MEIVLAIIGLLIFIIPTVVWNKSVQGKTIDYELIRKRKFYKLLSTFGLILFATAFSELFIFEEEIGYLIVWTMAIVSCRQVFDPYLDSTIMNDLEKQNFCLYLRPFNSDGKMEHFFGRTQSFEEMIIGELNTRVAQTYAIGNPGSCLPTIRSVFNVYANDEEWQSVVGKMSKEAGVILLEIGASDGCKWEITHCKRAKLLGKIMLIIRDYAALEIAKEKFGVKADIEDVDEPYLAYYDTNAQLWNLFEISSKRDINKVIVQFINSHSAVKELEEQNKIKRNWNPITATKVSSPKWPFVLMSILNPFVLVWFNNWPKKYKVISVISFLLFINIGAGLGYFWGDGAEDLALRGACLFLLCWIILFAIISPSISRYTYNWGSETVFRKMNTDCCLWVLALSGLEFLFGIIEIFQYGLI